MFVICYMAGPRRPLYNYISNHFKQQVHDKNPINIEYYKACSTLIIYICSMVFDVEVNSIV